LGGALFRVRVPRVVPERVQAELLRPASPEGQS
jgi:hypothetical protein